MSCHPLLASFCGPVQSGVVPLLDIVIHYQVTEQLPGVSPAPPCQPLSILLLSLLLKGVVVILPVYIQGRLPLTAGDQGQAVIIQKSYRPCGHTGCD